MGEGTLAHSRDWCRRAVRHLSHDIPLPVLWSFCEKAAMIRVDREAQLSVLSDLIAHCGLQ